MTEFNTPQDLAFAASDKINESAAKVVKQTNMMNFAVAVMAIGVIATGSGLLPALALMTSYSLWNMKHTRGQAIVLRDSFNQVAEGLGDEACTFQLDPLRRSLAKVEGFNKQDLNLKTHYQKNKNHFLFYGALSILSPILAPMLICKLINEADIAQIQTVKDSVAESQKNLRKKYPLHFDSTLS